MNAIYIGDKWLV